MRKLLIVFFIPILNIYCENNCDLLNNSYQKYCKKIFDFNSTGSILDYSLKCNEVLNDFKLNNCSKIIECQIITHYMGECNSLEFCKLKCAKHSNISFNDALCLENKCKCFELKCSN